MDTAKLETVHYLKLESLEDEDGSAVTDATVTADLLDVDNDDAELEADLSLAHDAGGTYRYAWKPQASGGDHDYSVGDTVKMVITAVGDDPDDEALEEKLTFRIT